MSMFWELHQHHRINQAASQARPRGGIEPTKPWVELSSAWMSSTSDMLLAYTHNRYK